MSIAQVRVTSLGERGLVSAIDAGDVHVALVPEPTASQLLSQGRAKLLADFRSPRAAATILGSPTVNAAVFTRADRRPPDRDLLGVVRALRKAEQRIHSADARALADRLPTRVVGEFTDSRPGSRPRERSTCRTGGHRRPASADDLDHPDPHSAAASR
jgi:ABC-type nitrate/sulfonate/bicarbonate transport system substrate-binding protein